MTKIVGNIKKKQLFFYQLIKLSTFQFHPWVLVQINFYPYCVSLQLSGRSQINAEKYLMTPLLHYSAIPKTMAKGKREGPMVL